MEKINESMSQNNLKPEMCVGNNSESHMEKKKISLVTKSNWTDLKKKIIISWQAPSSWWSAKKPYKTLVLGNEILRRQENAVCLSWGQDVDSLGCHRKNGPRGWGRTVPSQREPVRKERAVPHRVL